MKKKHQVVNTTQQSLTQSEKNRQILSKYYEKNITRAIKDKDAKKIRELLINGAEIVIPDQYKNKPHAYVLGLLGIEKLESLFVVPTQNSNQKDGFFYIKKLLPYSEKSQSIFYKPSDLVQYGLLSIFVGIQYILPREVLARDKSVTKQLMEYQPAMESYAKYHDFFKYKTNVEVSKRFYNTNSNYLMITSGDLLSLTSEQSILLPLCLGRAGNPFHVKVDDISHLSRESMQKLSAIIEENSAIIGMECWKRLWHKKLGNPEARASHAAGAAMPVVYVGLKLNGLQHEYSEKSCIDKGRDEFLGTLNNLQLSSFSPTVTTLRFRIDDETLKAVIAAIRGVAGIKHLDFSGGGITNASLECLSDLITNFKLESLKLSNNFISAKGAEMLFKKVEGSTLEVFDISKQNYYSQQHKNMFINEVIKKEKIKKEYEKDYTALLRSVPSVISNSNLKELKVYSRFNNEPNTFSRVVSSDIISDDIKKHWTADIPLRTLDVFPEFNPAYVDKGNVQCVMAQKNEVRKVLCVLEQGGDVSTMLQKELPKDKPFDLHIIGSRLAARKVSLRAIMSIEDKPFYLDMSAALTARPILELLQCYDNINQLIINVEIDAIHSSSKVGNNNSVSSMELLANIVRGNPNLKTLELNLPVNSKKSTDRNKVYSAQDIAPLAGVIKNHPSLSTFYFTALYHNLDVCGKEYEHRFHFDAVLKLIEAAKNTSITSLMAEYLVDKKDINGASDWVKRIMTSHYEVVTHNIAFYHDIIAQQAQFALIQREQNQANKLQKKGKPLTPVEQKAQVRRAGNKAVINLKKKGKDWDEYRRYIEKHYDVKQGQKAHEVETIESNPYWRSYRDAVEIEFFKTVNAIRIAYTSLVKMKPTGLTKGAEAIPMVVSAGLQHAAPGLSGVAPPGAAAAANILATILREVDKEKEKRFIKKLHKYFVDIISIKEAAHLFANSVTIRYLEQISLIGKGEVRQDKIPDEIKSFAECAVARVIKAATLPSKNKTRQKVQRYCDEIIDAEKISNPLEKSVLEWVLSIYYLPYKKGVTGYNNKKICNDLTESGLYTKPNFINRNGMCYVFNEKGKYGNVLVSDIEIELQMLERPIKTSNYTQPIPSGIDISLKQRKSTEEIISELNKMLDADKSLVAKKLREERIGEKVTEFVMTFNKEVVQREKEFSQLFHQTQLYFDQQCEKLEKQEKAQHIAKQKKEIYKDKALRTYYHFVNQTMINFTLGYQMLDLGVIVPNRNQSQDLMLKSLPIVAKLIEAVGEVGMGIGAGAKVASSLISQWLKCLQDKEIKNIQNFLGKLDAEEFAEEFARLLTLRYEYQIRKLSSNEEVLVLAKSVIPRVISYMLLPSKNKHKQHSLDVIADVKGESKAMELVVGVRNVTLHQGYANMNKKLKVPYKKQWTDSGVYEKPGLQNFDGKCFNKDEKENQDDSNLDQGRKKTKADKYGYIPAIGLKVLNISGNEKISKEIKLESLRSAGFLSKRPDVSLMEEQSFADKVRNKVQMTLEAYMKEGTQTQLREAAKHLSEVKIDRILVNYLEAVDQQTDAQGKLLRDIGEVIKKTESEVKQNEAQTLVKTDKIDFDKSLLNNSALRTYHTHVSVQSGAMIYAIRALRSKVIAPDTGSAIDLVAGSMSLVKHILEALAVEASIAGPLVKTVALGVKFAHRNMLDHTIKTMGDMLGDDVPSAMIEHLANSLTQRHKDQVLHISGQNNTILGEKGRKLIRTFARYPVDCMLEFLTLHADPSRLDQSGVKNAVIKAVGENLPDQLVVCSRYITLGSWYNSKQNIIKIGDKVEWDISKACRKSAINTGGRQVFMRIKEGEGKAQQKAIGYLGLYGYINPLLAKNEAKGLQSIDRKYHEGAFSLLKNVTIDSSPNTHSTIVRGNNKTDSSQGSFVTLVPKNTQRNAKKKDQSYVKSYEDSQESPRTKTL